MSEETPNHEPDDDALRAEFDRAREAMSLGGEAIMHARRILVGLLSEIADARSRGTINRQIWEARRIAGDCPACFSEAGQDSYLDQQVFYEKREGVFVEIGGYDGLTASNCLFFELMRGWSGLFVEPSPSAYRQAVEFRRCACLELAVAASAGRAEFLHVEEGYRQMGALIAGFEPDLRARIEADDRFRGEVVEVATKPLAQILDEAHLEAADYISLDLQGGETAALEAFPFERFRVTAWSVENRDRDRRIPDFMASKGYRRVEALGADDIYVFDGG